MEISGAAMLLAALTAAAASLATAAPLGAQDSTGAGVRSRPLVAPGSVVRVRGRDLIVGARPATVVEQHGDTLVLREQDGALALVPLDRVTELEVADGSRSRGSAVGRGARTGAIVGGIPSVILLGAAVTYDVQHHSDPCSELCIPATPVAAIVGVAVTTMTTLVGAAIGSVVPAGRYWTRVPVPAQVGVAPARGGGTAVALTLRF